MNSLVQICLLIFLFSSSCLFAQNFVLEPFTPLDSNIFKNLYPEHELFIPDSSFNLKENTNELPMDDMRKSGVVKFNNEGMAPMPKMEIQNDVNYTLQIKKYNFCYPYEPAESPKNKKTTEHLTDPKK